MNTFFRFCVRFSMAALTVFAFGALPLAHAELPPQALEHMPVCAPGNQNDVARCHARVVVNGKGKPNVTTAPSGYGPKQFTAAYNPAGATVSSGTIIAIVDAYNDPTAFSDLQQYSSAFGLKQLSNCPASSGTPAAPCFQKVDQRGGTSYPVTNGGWALEISLDVQAAHALCPDCNILLVESDSNSFTNLLAAEDRAVSMGAVVVSNSWGGSEFSGETTYDSHFNHAGTAFTVSSGDSGYGTEYPAASRFVTAVGGTSLSLTQNSNGTYSYARESAWSGAGSGCSTYETKPSFQHDSACFRRMIADVSADADPSTGAAVYDTTPYNGSSGWFKVGGTSLASPLVAAMYAIGGVPSGTQANSMPYASVSSLHDVQGGSNGHCNRFSSYFCTAVFGYDGPTGLGTPNGPTAF